MAAHADALLFLATDDPGYLRRVRARYGASGRLVTAAPPPTLLGFRHRPASVRKRSGGAGDDGGVVAGEGDGGSMAGTHGTSGAYEKGEAALVDALLLSRCDFLLKTTSAVAEFALWVNPPLQHRHLDLQMTDRRARPGARKTGGDSRCMSAWCPVPA